MKHAKDRVIALDYFRGICILLVIINHASFFSWPLTYLTSSGVLWTSAAEMFFLISGITLWVVRGKYITTNFWTMVRKMWRRAAAIYLVYLLAVVASLYLAFVLTGHNMATHMPGHLPAASGLSLLTDLMTFKFSIGWANFLMFYAVFMVFAPFIMRSLKSRWWFAAPIASLGLYAASAYGQLPASPYLSFAVWQAYFVLGMLVGRWRLEILRLYFSLSRDLARKVAVFTVAAAGLMLVFSYFLSHPASRVMYHLSQYGLLPSYFYRAYSHIYENHDWLSFLLQNNRAGLLRPVAALVMMAGAYVIYQRFKRPLLKFSGSFVNSMGRETLWIFVAQALAIPLIASLHFGHIRMINDLILTSLLVSSMYLVAKRRVLLPTARAYMRQLTLAIARIRKPAVYEQDAS